MKATTKTMTAREYWTSYEGYLTFKTESEGVLDVRNRHELSEVIGKPRWRGFLGYTFYSKTDDITISDPENWESAAKEFGAQYFQYKSGEIPELKLSDGGKIARKR